MLDLANPLGVFEGLIFYRDHEINDLVYYFPDEVSLATQSGTDDKGLPLYELFFQIFSEGDMVEGGIEDLRKTAGSILSLDVQCTVAPARLKEALKKVKASGNFPDTMNATLPQWRDGTVNLLVLDAITNKEETISKDSFVKSIVGTNKPSLMSSDLRSIFNVRLNREGTTLIQSALDGDTGNVAGVLYDLKFMAIRPSLNLHVWANLERCQESVSHQLSLKVELPYYVKLSLGAEFEWITRKLEEEGHMKIDVLSEAEDAEAKQMMDEIIKDFKESVLREMFQPYINPQTPSIPLATAAASAQSLIPVVGVAYKFTKEKISQDKIIDIDYRERSAVERTHTPQSHLWVMGKQIAANRSRYIQNLTFSKVWLEQALSVSIVYDFDDAVADLLSAEIIIWRSQFGITENVKEGRFSIPDNISPIKNLTLFKGSTGTKIAWAYDKGETIGYYYQIRFTYSSKIDNISSPAEIITRPVLSTNQDLIIFPDTFIFFKTIEVRAGNIDFNVFKSVDVTLKLKDADGKVLGVETITIDSINHTQVWSVRGEDKTMLYVEATKEFHYNDERSSLKTEPQYLQEDELIVNKPFQKSAYNLIPVIGGINDAVKAVLLEITVTSPSLIEPVKTLYRINGPAFNIDQIAIPLNSEKDIITYEAKAIMLNATILQISNGNISSNALVIDLTRLNNTEVTFTWQGRSPDALGLKSLVLELHQIGTPATEVETIEFKGDTLPENVTKTFPVNDKMEWRIVKRFQNGNKEKGDFTPLNSKKITINAEDPTG